jgi:hypothetical protein
MKRGGILALAVLALAACGGGAGSLSKSAYEAKLRSAFSSTFARPRTLSVTLASVATTYEQLASRLKGLRPPANVRNLNGELVAGASKQAAALNALAASIKGKSKAVRDRILAQFDPSSIPGLKEFDQAVAVLEAKGYRFRPSGGT